VWVLPKTEAGKESCAPTFCMHGAHDRCMWRIVHSPMHALGAFVFLSGPISNFLSFLGLRLQITYIGTLGIEFIPFGSIMRPLESLFLSLETSQFFGCS